MSNTKKSKADPFRLAHKKQAAETAYVKLLLEKLGLGKPYKLTKSEAPDFVLTLGERVIGIEVIEVNVPSTSLGHRQLEGMEDKILAKARSLFIERGLPFLSVGLFFNIQKPLSPTRLAEIAKGVADAIEFSIPEIGGRRELEYSFSSKAQPCEVDLIHVARHEGADKQWWQVVGGSWVTRKALSIFQDAITIKSRKYLAYREKCHECWLVLGAEGTRQSSAIRPEEETLLHRYIGDFERVFFLRLENGELHELKIATKN